MESIGKTLVIIAIIQEKNAQEMSFHTQPNSVLLFNES